MHAYGRVSTCQREVAKGGFPVPVLGERSTSRTQQEPPTKVAGPDPATRARPGLKRLGPTRVELNRLLVVVYSSG